MPWIWINPKSEPEETVEAANRLVRNCTPDHSDDEDMYEELSDFEVGFEIADDYNKAAEIGMYSTQTKKNYKPYFS